MNNDSGVLGAGVGIKSVDPRERWDGRRLPIEPPQSTSCSTLALVSTMLGCLIDSCGLRLRHMVGSESDLEDKIFDSLSLE